MLYDLGFYRDKYGALKEGPRIGLLGVLYAMPLHVPEEGNFAMPFPTDLFRIPVERVPVHLALVVKAEKILDFQPLIKDFVFKVLSEIAK